MPRGKPKRGQFSITVIAPDGDRVEWATHRDIVHPEEFRAVLLRTLDQVRLLVEPKPVSAETAVKE